MGGAGGFASFPPHPPFAPLKGVKGLHEALADNEMPVEYQPSRIYGVGAVTAAP